MLWQAFMQQQLLRCAKPWPNLVYSNRRLGALAEHRAVRNRIGLVHATGLAVEPICAEQN